MRLPRTPWLPQAGEPRAVLLACDSHPGEALIVHVYGLVDLIVPGGGEFHLPHAGLGIVVHRGLVEAQIQTCSGGQGALRHGPLGSLFRAGCRGRGGVDEALGLDDVQVRAVAGVGALAAALDPDGIAVPAAKLLQGIQAQLGDLLLGLVCQETASGPGGAAEDRRPGCRSGSRP